MSSNAKPLWMQLPDGALKLQLLGEIADLLHVSAKTISTHKMRLMQKLGVDNNADLVRYAIRHGIASG